MPEILAVSATTLAFFPIDSAKSTMALTSVGFHLSIYMFVGEGPFQVTFLVKGVGKYVSDYSRLYRGHPC